VPASQPVACPTCLRCFPSSSLLSLHLVEPSTTCTLCGVQCCSSAVLGEHVAAGCSPTSEGRLARRNSMMARVAEEAARVAGRLVDPTAYYTTPLAEEEEVEDETFCERCGENFSSGYELAQHMRREHGETGERSAVSGVVRCGMGGCAKVFRDRVFLKEHRSSQHPEVDEFQAVEVGGGRLACPVCSEHFRNRNTCTVHIRVSHLGWTRSTLFPCPECGKGCSSLREVERHKEATHQGIRTLCPLCDKPVIHLRSHMDQVHREVEGSTCPQCGKNFKRKADLTRHLVLVHMKVRNHGCDMCGKKFGEKKDMNRHKNAVHFGMKVNSGWPSQVKRREVRSAVQEYRGWEVEEKVQMKQEYTEVGLEEKEHMKQEYREVESNMVTLEDGSTINIPMEFIEQTEGLLGEEVVGDVVGEEVVEEESQVMFEVDPSSPGGYRIMVVRQEG